MVHSTVDNNAVFDALIKNSREWNEKLNSWSSIATIVFLSQKAVSREFVYTLYHEWNPSMLRLTD